MAPEHEEDVQVNFKLKASKLLSSTFCDCQRENRIPKFMVPDRWALLLEHWSTDEKFKKRSEIGKMARALEKGCSLHTGGAISQEKELGRPVAIAEMFKVTHVKKSTNPTEEERWIEPRAQETYDRYIRISQEYRSTLPLESQDIPFTQEEMRIFGNRVLVNRLEVQSTAIQKRSIRRRSLGIVVHHPQASMARIER
ncbi:hypothetical protein KY285_032937 [Solanum tuberosum]|nr:hypothetical protein KY289_033045 [Solanum tuberosum]KAH0647689.1 hypothetical protein KY285_032937 [Solanum tuberosum]